MNLKEIENKFANTENIYYGHGIGANNEEKVKSIFKYGLRCSHNELYWTTIAFGKGSESLFRDKESTMSNWEHKDSKQIIIVSLPEKFHHLDITGTPLFQKKHAAFYNSISKEKAKEFGISQGLYLKPEFIMGMYDTEKKDFVMNDRYYENLPEEEQKRLLDEVKKQYIEIIKQSDWTLSEYAQILQDVGLKNPLTSKEIKIIDDKKVDELQPDMVAIPNEIKIPRKQYEKEQSTMKQQKKISISNLKSSISKGKVTSQETKKTAKDIKKIKEIKRLQVLQRTGQTLTKEQKLLLEEHIRQNQQAQIQFQQRQKSKNSKGNDIEL